jgi:DNA-binding NarL/FixJ family response regulator
MQAYTFQSLAMTTRVTGTMSFGEMRYLRHEESARRPAPGPSVALTRRQEQVLQLLIQGYSNKQIACALSMGHGTVKVHVTALLQKLNATSRTAAAVAGERLLAGRSATPLPRTPDISRLHLFGPSCLGA